jgi:hypothetical protein|tara:strand:+ start:604 stop:798 length:195 start_codon:yes stop_codon:yes gene_type:complete
MNLTLQEILDRLRNIESDATDAYYQIPDTDENENARGYSDGLRYEISNLIEQVEEMNNQGYTIS